MSALLYAVNEIRAQIPNELLQAGMLIDEPETTAYLTSLDDKLITKVLRKRVLVDANIVGGMELIVPLVGLSPLHFEDFYTVYRIDKDLTMNREIVSALGLSSMPVNYGLGHGQMGYGAHQQQNSTYGNTFNPLMSVANRIGDAAAPSGAMHNAHLELVGPNTVLVNMHYRLLSHMGIRCIVENESNLNNIQPRSWKDFSLMCVLATKAYLYNKLIVPINSGYLSGGQELGMFKNILENYSDSEEDYRTYIHEVWARVAYMNDTSRYNRLLGSMLSPDL